MGSQYCKQMLRIGNALTSPFTKQMLHYICVKMEKIFYKRKYYKCGIGLLSIYYVRMTSKYRPLMLASMRFSFSLRIHMLVQLLR